MTVNMYLERIDDEQVVAIYDDKRNLHYLGKAENAPLNCRFEFINVHYVGNELRINDVTEEQTEEQEIIRQAKNLKKTPYGNYLYCDELSKIISRVMGYKYYTFSHNDYHFDDRCWEYIEKLENKKIIKTSKTGLMFKFA